MTSLLAMSLPRKSWQLSIRPTPRCGVPTDIILEAEDVECSRWSLTLPDYNANFVTAIKGIPPAHRSWDAQHKCWWVNGEWAEHAADIAKKWFPKAEVRWVEADE